MTNLIAFTARGALTRSAAGAAVALAALASCANAPEPAAPPAAPVPRGIQQQAAGSALRWVACVDCATPTAKTLPSVGAVAAVLATNQMRAAVAMIVEKAALAASSPSASAPASVALAPAPSSEAGPRPQPRDAAETSLARAAVRFASDTATLTEEDRTKLRQMRPLLTAATRIRITGFTDARGSQEPNDRLASYRALAVVLFLRDDLDVTGPHVTGTGRPLCCYRAHNTDEIGRSVNRRAELDIEMPADAASEQLIKQHASRLEPARGTGNPA